MMKQQQLETLGNMSVGATTATGFVAFVEQHASFITVCIGLAGFLLAATFYTLNYLLERKYKKKKYETDEHADNPGQSL